MKIVCIGDSFTRGFGVKEKDNWISNLKTKGFDFLNKGINGDTTSGMLARFQQDVVSYSPQYVLVTGGINDFISGSSPEIPQNNYMAMIHQAFHHNIIPIIGIAPGFLPNAVRSDWANFCDFDQVLVNYRQLRLWLKRFCQTFHVFSIDFYQEFEAVKGAHPSCNFYLDGLHLTAEGHGHISEIFMDTFQKM